MNLGLEGRVALVCGASKGLGRAIARELALEDARVAICARDPVVLEQTAGEIGRDTFAIAGDLALPGEPARVVEACLARFGRLDILVSNTGGPPAATFDQLEPEDWNAAVRLLLTSAVELSRSALPSMRENRWGRILAVTSITAREPIANLMLSNALRPAVAGFAHALAREVARDGITVNTILPGFTRTDRMVELEEAGPASVAAAEAEIPLGRLAEPEEFAALAAFLVSERASYITGSSFAVDGGWLRGVT
jgi:3-oxoacyl-[acyl-carrier protein] reductase